MSRSYVPCETIEAENEFRRNSKPLDEAIENAIRQFEGRRNNLVFDGERLVADRSQVEQPQPGRRPLRRGYQPSAKI